MWYLRHECRNIFEFLCGTKELLCRYEGQRGEERRGEERRARDKREQMVRVNIK